MNDSLGTDELQRIDRALAAREQQLRDEMDAVATPHAAQREAGEAREPGDDESLYVVRDGIDLDLTQAARDSDELRSVLAARERITAGTYGVCVECNAKIALERLHAQPAAPRCLTCQARAEG